MLSSRARIKAVISHVDEIVRKKFYNGSCNRPEDCLDFKKYSMAEQELIHSPSEPWPTFEKLLKGTENLTSGVCEQQAGWAMRELILLDVYPVHYGLVCKEEKPHHAVIVIGDPEKNPDDAMIYDPHGLESVYPYKDFLIGGHHANRYGDTILLKLSKTHSFDDTYKPGSFDDVVRQFILGTNEKIKPFKFPASVEEKEEAPPFRSKKDWQTEAERHGQLGLKAYNNKDFAIALKEYQTAMTILINLHGEDSHQLFSAYYNVISTLYNLKKYAEAFLLGTKHFIEIFKNFSKETASEKAHFNQCTLKFAVKMAFISCAIGELLQADNFFSLAKAAAKEINWKEKTMKKKLMPFWVKAQNDFTRATKDLHKKASAVFRKK